MLPSAEDRLQLGTIGGDHLLLLSGRFDDHGDLITVAVDQGLAPFKLGNGADLGVGQLQDIPDIVGLVRLQIQDDLVLGIVNDGPSVLAVLQTEEVAEVLGGCNGCAAVAADDLENLQTELRCHPVGGGADELPDLVDHDGLLLGSVGLDVVPDIVQGDHHANRQELALQLRQIQDDILIGQIHIGLPVEALGRAGDEAADDGCHTGRHGVLQQVSVEVTQDGHLLQLRWENGAVGVQGAVVMGDAELVVGLDEGFIEHLLLLVGHVGDQQGEENHQLLDLPGQHGVHVVVIHLVDQLHLRADGMPDLHHIDAVWRAGSDPDELSADPRAGSLEFMALDGGDDIALDTPHAHPQGKKLQSEGLARTGGAAHGQIGILVDLRVEQVNDAQGVVVPVHSQKDSGIIGHLEACEHIGRSGAAGQHIALGLLQELGTDLQEGHDTAKGCLLLEAAFAQVHIHRLEHIDHPLLAPQKLLIGLGRDRHEDGHIEQVFIMVGDPMLDEVACLNGIGQLLIIRTGVLHPLELGAVQPDALGHLIDGLTPVLPGQVDIDINTLAGIDEAGHPSAPDGAGVAVGLDIEEAVIPAIHDNVAAVGQIQAPGGDKVPDRDMGDGIDTDRLSLGRHGIHDDPVDPVCEGFLHTAAAVEEHIQDLSNSVIRILGLDDAVAALQKVGSGTLLRTDQHGIDPGIVVRLISADGLILEDQKEAPGQGFSGTHILNESDIILAHCPALFIFLLRKLPADRSDMLIRIGLPGDGLELELHG